jgi:hypothetical protein
MAFWHGINVNGRFNGTHTHTYKFFLKTGTIPRPGIQPGDSLLRKMNLKLAQLQGLDI